MNTHSWVTRCPTSCRIAALALLLPSLAAGQTGSVRGTVTDRATAQPLNAVRVQIGATAIVGATDERGQFTVRNVPPGQHVLRFTRIGYRPESQSVSVTAADTAPVTVTMGPSAVELSTVVVTGTGGAVERRKIGTSMGSVDVQNLQETMPSNDLGSVLSAKIPGVRSVGTGGGAGGAKDLRIRGMASFQLDQRPVVYVDGVRVDTRASEWTNATGIAGKIACCSFAGGTSTDRLSDINPDDIERVEVLKGAAAATLYGSEATNGVIQIFTKRGRSESRPSWAVGVTTGFDRLRENLPTKLFPRFTGPDGTRARDANELIENGLMQNYDVSVNGGGLRSTYFASAGYLNHEGSIQPNWERKGNFRLNLSFLPTDRWTVETRTLFTRSRVAELQAGNNWTALLGNAINGDPRKATATRPFGEAWVPVSDIKQIQTTADANRWTGGLTVNYQMMSNFTHRLTVGTDAVTEEKSRYFPFGLDYGTAGVTNGQRNLGYRNYRTTTVDYLAHLNFGLGRHITSDLSFGGQGFWENERLNISVGNGFAGPGVSTVSAASITTGGETFVETVNLGLLAQNRFSIGDKLFTTIGVRVDGNSAFGTDYGFQTYPKADVSWVVSDHGIFPDWVSSLKLRSAIGRAGKMPGAFDHFLSFTSRAVFAGTPGVVPDNPGNPDLRPETTTEIESGFEAGFFNDRLGIDASIYRAETKNAIVPLPNAPSQGFQSSRRVNIGAIENRGWEASVNYLAIARGRFEWTTNVRLDGNENEVTDLGGVTLSGNNVRLGYPVRGVWARKATGFSVVDGKPVTTRSDTAVYFGPPLPTMNGSLSNTFRYGRFQLYGLLTMERGAVFNNGDRPYRVRQGGADEYLQFLNPDGSTTFAADSVLQYWNILDAIDKRDNVRIRELSLSYTVPDELVGRFRLGRTTMTLAGQNLTWWDDCNCVDPNMNYAAGDPFLVNSGFLAQPSPRTVRFSVRTRF